MVASKKLRGFSGGFTAKKKIPSMERTMDLNTFYLVRQGNVLMEHNDARSTIMQSNYWSTGLLCVRSSGADGVD